MEDPISIEGFKEYWDMFADNHIDEEISIFLPFYLKSCKCISEDKNTFFRRVC